MFNAFGRKFVIAVGLFVSLMASASAYGLGGGGGGSLEGGIVIVAPCSVIAGSPIIGFVTGGKAPMTASGGGQNGNLPGSPAHGYSDPVNFIFMTFEPMAGSVVTILANDSAGKTDCATVQVL